MSKCVKIEPLYEGWLCSGFPRIEGNPRQVNLKVEMKDGAYNLWIQDRFKWVQDKVLSHRLTVFRVICPRCSREKNSDGPDLNEYDVYCDDCDYPIPLIRPCQYLIEWFCYNYFQHSQVEEYIYALQVTWLWMAPQLGLPKEIAVMIAYLLEKQEREEIFHQNKNRRLRLK